jgi:5'-AMP-activated protein kinase regulatory gamma subunit
MEYFSKTPVTEVLKDFKMITAMETDSISTLLQTMSKNNISSVPLVDAFGNVKKSVDMLDLVSYAVAKLDLNQKSTKMPQSLQIQSFLSKEVKTLHDFSTRNPWYALPYRKSVKKALHLLSQPHFHRIYVEENGKLIGLITQSKMLDLLLNHREGFEETYKMTVRELFPEARQPKVISSTDTLMNAFQMIHRARVSGLAVVNQHGVLVGNISASDLKYAKVDQPDQFLQHLQEPIESFLDWKKSEHQGWLEWFFGSTKESRFQPIVVKETDSMESVMEKCNKTKIHRVYVVDEQQKPLYVISLSDILAQFQLFPVNIGPFRG